MKNSAIIIPLMLLIVVFMGVNDLAVMFGQFDEIGDDPNVTLVQKTGKALFSLWPFVTGLAGVWTLYTMNNTSKGDITLSIAIVLTIFIISYTLFQWQRTKGTAEILGSNELSSARIWTSSSSGGDWSTTPMSEMCTNANTVEQCSAQEEGKYVIDAAASDIVGSGDKKTGTAFCSWESSPEDEDGAGTCQVVGDTNSSDECKLLLPPTAGNESLFGEMGHKVYRAVFYFTIVVVAVCASVHVSDGYFKNLIIALPIVAVIGVDVVFSWLYSEYINSNEGEFNNSGSAIVVKNAIDSPSGNIIADLNTAADSEFIENTRAIITPEMLLINFMRGDNGALAVGDNSAWFTDPAKSNLSLGAAVKEDDRTFINSHFVFTTAFYMVLIFLLIIYSMGFFGNSASIVPVYVTMIIILAFPFIMTQIFLQECSINTIIGDQTAAVPADRALPTKTVQNPATINIADSYTSGHVTTGNLFPSPRVRTGKTISQIREERTDPGFCTFEKYGGLQTLAAASLLIAVLSSIDNKNQKVVALIISIVLILAIESMVSKEGKGGSRTVASYQRRGPQATYTWAAQSPVCEPKFRSSLSSVLNAETGADAKCNLVATGGTTLPLRGRNGETHTCTVADRYTGDYNCAAADSGSTGSSAATCTEAATSAITADTTACQNINDDATQMLNADACDAQMTAATSQLATGQQVRACVYIPEVPGTIGSCTASEVQSTEGICDTAGSNGATACIDDGVVGAGCNWITGTCTREGTGELPYNNAHNTQAKCEGYRGG